MKILHIINSLSAGGAEKLVEESALYMNRDENVEAHVLILSDKKKFFGEKLKKNNIQVDVVPRRKIYCPMNVIYIKKHILKGKYDIVHSHLFPCNYWVSLVSRSFMKKYRPKFITTEHSTHNRRRGRFYFRILEQFMYSAYDTVISISDGTQKNLMDWIKISRKNRDKFKVVYNGVDLASFSKAVPCSKSEIDSTLTENTKLLCMVGRFSKQKDQATVIKAMKYLPENVFLLLAGDGPLKEENEKLADISGVSQRVKFLGIRKDIPEILKTSDLIVVSSHWEGFGLVAIEGMAAGKPVVASNISGLSEIVSGAGILFEKENEKDLADKIKWLLDREKEYEKVAKRCIERSKKYDIKKMSEEYLKIYRTILTGKI